MMAGEEARTPEGIETWQALLTQHMGELSTDIQHYDCYYPYYSRSSTFPVPDGGSVSTMKQK